MGLVFNPFTGNFDFTGAGTGTVTSVAASVPAFLSISGSPVTTSGTLAITLSGTALPVANGGTAGTTANAGFNSLSPLTTKGDVLGFSTVNARLAAGTDGQVLTADAASTLGFKWATGGSGANTGLSNLASVAINTSMLPGAAGTLDDGSGTLPWRYFYLAGDSGTPGTNNFKITGTSTSGTRTITLPNVSDTLAQITTPTFITNITAPLVIGGTTTTSPLTLKTTSGVGTTNADMVFQVGNNGATEAMRILNSGFTGIGTAAPATLFHVASNTTATGIVTLEQASADADGPDITIRKTRGTVASPTVITTADELGTINFSGYSGAGGYVVGAQIKAISSGTVATTRIPGQLSFYTGTNAAPTVLTERMKIMNTGKIGVGVGPSAQFEVAATGSTTPGTISAALAALRLTPNAGDQNVILAFGAADATVNRAAIYSEGSSGTALGDLRFAVGLADVVKNPALIISGEPNYLFGVGSAIPTSAVNNVCLFKGTAPASSPANQVNLYAKATATNQTNLYSRNENGKIEQLTGLRDRVSTQFDSTSTTLAAITGLSINVEAGISYAFKAALWYTADVVGGQKYAMAGTATATAIIYNITSMSDATNAFVITSRQTALAGSAGQAGSTAGLCMIEGLITVNAAGTLLPQFALNAASGTSSILVGSYFEVITIGD